MKPSKDVLWSVQSWEEKMVTFLTHGWSLEDSQPEELRNSEPVENAVCSKRDKCTPKMYTSNWKYLRVLEI